MTPSTSPWRGGRRRPRSPPRCENASEVRQRCRRQAPSPRCGRPWRPGGRSGSRDRPGSEHGRFHPGPSRPRRRSRPCRHRDPGRRSHYPGRRRESGSGTERIGVQAEAIEGIGSETGRGRRRHWRGAGGAPAGRRRSAGRERPSACLDWPGPQRGSSPRCRIRCPGWRAPVGVAVEAIDADDVGTPVGQEGASHGNEHPLGQLYDAYAVECPFIHRWLASTRRRGCSDLFVSCTRHSSATRHSRSTTAGLLFR